MTQKEITTKSKRHEIYDWIEENIGEIPRGKKGFLSELLKDLVRVHNFRLVKMNDELFEALNEKGRILDELRHKEIRNKHHFQNCVPKPKRDLILE